MRLGYRSTGLVALCAREGKCSHREQRRENHHRQGGLDGHFAPLTAQVNQAYLSVECFFLEMGFRDRGSSTRASPAPSGRSTVSVARVLFQMAVPRESCSTLPLGPF